MTVTIIANGFQEDYIINLVNALAKEGIHVDLIGSNIYLNYPIHDNVNFLNIRGSHEEGVSRLAKIKRIFNYYFKLIKYTSKTKSRVFHVQWLRFYYFEGVIINSLFRLFGKKVIYTAHDVLPHSLDTPKLRKLFKKIYHKSSHLVVHTEYISQRLANEFGIDKKKVSVVKHGVYKLILHQELTKENCRNDLKLNENDIVLLFFGYITAYKGLPLLIEAFNRLEQKYVNIKLLIAGKVSQEYQKEFSELESKITSNNITITTKYLDDIEVEQHYKASDIVILPYLEASQSGVMFISYAYGKPVIAPNFGGFPYDIVLEKTGLLFEKQDVNDLSNKIDQAIKLFCKPNDDTMNYIQNFARENYSWSGSAKALEKVYRNSYTPL
jgi:glycosyltransferase involved in cell wall biosynthesis